MLEHLQLELGGELTVLPPLKTRLTLLAEMGNPNLYQFLVKPKSGSDAKWKLLLKEYPQLIRRPVVVLDDGGISQGFSDNGFKKLFGSDR